MAVALTVTTFCPEHHLDAGSLENQIAGSGDRLHGADDYCSLQLRRRRTH